MKGISLRKTGITGSLSLLCLWGSVLFAQIEKDTIHIPELVFVRESPLTEAGLPVRSVDSLLAARFEMRSLASLLPLFSPVYIRSNGRGAAATATFRGTSAAHTQVLWNGLNINSPMRGDMDLSLLQTGFADELRILTGSASLLETSGSLGGTIQLEQKADWNTRRMLKYSQLLGSFGSFTEQAEAAFRSGRFYSRSRVYLDQSQNDFPFYNHALLPARDDRQENADWKKKGLMQEWYFRPHAAAQTGLQVSLQEARRELPQLMSYQGGERKEYRDHSQLRIGLNHSREGRHSLLKVRAGFSGLQMHYYLENLQADFVNYDSRSREYSFQQRTDYTLEGEGRWGFRTGYVLRYDRVHSRDHVRASGYQAEQGELAWLTALSYRFSSELSGTVLNRLEWYDGELVPLIPSLGLEYQSDITYLPEILLNLSRNYRKPSLNDRYWIPGGNPDLQPEQGFQAELMLRKEIPAKQGSIHAELSTYRARIKDWILWQPATSGAYYWEAENIRHVLSTGLEASVLMEGKLAAEFSYYLRLQYSYTHSGNLEAVESVDERRRRQLLYIPQQHAACMAQLEFREWYLYSEFRYTGRRYTTSSNEVTDWESVLNPYSLLDMELGRLVYFQDHRLAFSLKVKNLFNTDYMMVLWRPMPGRYLECKISYQWQK